MLIRPPVLIRTCACRCISVVTNTLVIYQRRNPRSRRSNRKLNPKLSRRRNRNKKVSTSRLVPVFLLCSFPYKNASVLLEQVLQRSRSCIDRQATSATLYKVVMMMPPTMITIVFLPLPSCAPFFPAGLCTYSILHTCDVMLCSRQALSSIRTRNKECSLSRDCTK